MPLPLQTPRLLIREWNILDGAAYFQLSQDSGFNANSFIDYNQSTQDLAEQKVIEWALVFSQTKMGVFPIFLKENKKLIGICAVRPIIFGGKELHFEVMCRLAKKYWRNGYASEVMQALFQYAFTDLGLKQIISYVHPEDAESCQFLEKVGMSFLKSTTYQKSTVEVYHVNPQ